MGKTWWTHKGVSRREGCHLFNAHNNLLQGMIVCMGGERTCMHGVSTVWFSCCACHEGSVIINTLRTIRLRIKWWFVINLGYHFVKVVSVSILSICRVPYASLTMDISTVFFPHSTTKQAQKQLTSHNPPPPTTASPPSPQRDSCSCAAGGAASPSSAPASAASSARTRRACLAAWRLRAERERMAWRRRWW